MRVLDNVNGRFGDDLKRELKDGSRLRIAAATFSLFAYEALREELQKIEELHFLFSEPSFLVGARAEKKQRRQFYIPQGQRGESSLYGTEFEIRLRNRLTQKAIAKECAEWIRDRVSFRSNSSGQPMPQFATVDENILYNQIQGFTTSDLGFEKSRSLMNHVTKSGEPIAVRHFTEFFDELWDDEQKVKDVKYEVVTNYGDLMDVVKG